MLGRGRISHLVKMHNFFENPKGWIVMIIKEESSKIVNFMTPVARVLEHGYDH